MSIKRFSSPALLMASLCLASSAYGQTSARLTGTVTDASGAVVPHVQVTATNTGTSLTTMVESNASGEYAFNSLPVGNYTVKTVAAGFAPLTNIGVVLTIGQSATLDISLKTGDAQEAVTVTGGVDLINTTTAEIGQIVDEKTIKELPLNGRDPSSLVLLASGVTNELFSQASTLTSNNSFPTESGASAGGQRQGSTWYLLDGVSNMDTFDLLALPFPNADATQEFRVISNNFDARNGFAPSAIVDIQTKAGTNQFHGGAFEFLRNNVLNAANPFSGAVDQLLRNQFGGYIGGPVLKDKLFFFANYQGTRQSYTSNTNTSYTPTLAERNGDFSALLTLKNPDGTSAAINLPAPFVNNKINPNLYSPGAVALLKDIPLGGDPATGRINFAQPKQVQDFNELTSRLDYTLSDKHRFFARSFQYYFTQPAESIPGNILSGILGSRGVYFNEVVNHTWTISPSTLNTLALAFNTFDFHTGTQVLDANGNPLCLSQFINVQDPANGCYLEDLNASNGNNSTYLAAIGFSSFSSNPNDTKRRDYSLTETLTKTIGRHTVSAGGELIYRHHTEQSSFNQSPVIGFNGQYTGAPFADFLLGYASGLSQGAGESGSTSGYLFGIYAQDQYKVKPNVTLTLGLRWDPSTPPSIKGGRGADYVPGQQSTRYPNAPLGLVFPGDKGITDSLFNASYGYFEPRVGIAWSPNPTTTVRSAFGTFVTPFEDAFYNRVWDVAPFAPSYSPQSSTTQYVPFDNPWTNFLGGGGLAAGKSPFPPFASPNQVPANTATFGQGASVPATFIPNLKLGVTESWNLSVEQQFAKNIALHIAYVASESYHQATTVERNPGETGIAGQADANRGLRPNTSFGSIIQVQDGATSSYSSLQAGIERRFSNGFQIQSNFTWSRTTDVGGSGDPTFESSVSDPLNIAHDKGLSSLNVPIVWVTNGIYQGPTFRNHNFFVRNTLGGWELSGIYTAESGVAFTINGGKGNNLSGFDVGQDRADRVYSQPLNIRQGGKANWINHYFNTAAFTNNAIGTPGTSQKFSLQEPPVNTMDLAIIKNWELKERLHTQFRWEMFNALNHPSYGEPDNNPEDQNFGQITNIGPIAPRVMQAGLKVTF